jgi:hypothetical protein
MMIMIMIIHCCHISHVQGTTLINIKKSFFKGINVFIIVFTQEIKVEKMAEPLLLTFKYAFQYEHTVSVS